MVKIGCFFGFLNVKTPEGSKEKSLAFSAYLNCNTVHVNIGNLSVLSPGHSILTAAILKTMALTPHSDRLASWLVPPVQAHLEGRQQ